MPEKPELTVLIHSGYPLSDGTPDGVKDSIIQLKPYLEDIGVKVTLVGPRTKNNLADYTFGVAIPFRMNNTVLRSGASFNIKRAKQILRAVKPDIVEFNAPEASPTSTHTLMSATNRVREYRPMTVGHFHSRAENLDLKTRLVVASLNNLKKPTWRKGMMPISLTEGMLNTILYSFDARIANSQDTADFWNQEFGMEDFHIIHNGVETEALRPDLEKRVDWQDGKKTIFTTCRHDRRKGLADLLQAYYLLTKVKGRTDIKLKIGGQGDCTDELKILAVDLRLPDVEFLGIQNREMLGRSFRSADICVFPSIGGEGWGRVLLEAEAC